jgi:hypothetical protein
MVRAQKRDFHPKTPPVIQANFSGRPAVSTQMPRAIPSPSPADHSLWKLPACRTQPAFLFCAFSIAYFKGTRRTNRRDFCGQSAERSKKFLYNLDKLPHSVINLGLYDVRSYFMSLK